LDFLTGKKSKLARLFEDCIRDKRDIEVSFSNSEVIVGKLVGYELSASHCILVVTVPTENNQRYVINFREGVKFMRVPQKASQSETRLAV